MSSHGRQGRHDRYLPHVVLCAPPILIGAIVWLAGAGPILFFVGLAHVVMMAGLMRHVD